MSKLAFLYPGQGSQFEGMGLDFIESSPKAKERYLEAESVLGWPPAELSKPENSDKLSITLYTQPLLYTLSCVVAEHLIERGIQPSVVIGHSAGE